MRKESFVFSRKMTSSRQSPRMSAESAGLAFVPLFDETPAGASMGLDVLVFQFHFEIVVPSRISRSRSPSHQLMKLIWFGCVGLTCAPLAFIRPPRVPHIS